MERQNTVLIDWLSITSKIDSPESMMALIGLPDIHTWEQKKGACGYDMRYWRDNISIHYKAGEDSGVWMEMSGSGCRAFETYSDGNYDRIFRALIDNPDAMNITRLDVAFDEYTGILDIDRLCEDTRKQKYRTNAIAGQRSYWHVVESVDGKSLQVGSPKSDVLVRIYDKLAERCAKIRDKREQEKILDDIRHWIRVEIQMRDEHAREFVKYLYPDVEKITQTDKQEMTLGQAYSGVLQTYLDYGYETPARGHPDQMVWHRFDYWQNVLGESAKLSIYHKPGVDYNLMRATNYVANQAGNCVDALLQIYGISGFVNLIENRRIKPNSKYRNLVRRNGTALDYMKVQAQKEQERREQVAYEKLSQILESMDEPFISSDGTRYCRCEACGKIATSTEFRIIYNLPGKRNLGICKDCF